MLLLLISILGAAGFALFGALLVKLGLNASSVTGLSGLAAVPFSVAATYAFGKVTGPRIPRRLLATAFFAGLLTLPVFYVTLYFTAGPGGFLQGSFLFAVPLMVTSFCFIGAAAKRRSGSTRRCARCDYELAQEITTCPECAADVTVPANVVRGDLHRDLAPLVPAAILLTLCVAVYIANFQMSSLVSARRVLTGAALLPTTDVIDLALQNTGGFRREPWDEVQQRAISAEQRDMLVTAILAQSQRDRVNFAAGDWLADQLASGLPPEQVASIAQGLLSLRLEPLPPAAPGGPPRIELQGARSDVGFGPFVDVQELTVQGGALQPSQRGWTFAFYVRRPSDMPVVIDPPMQLLPADAPVLAWAVTPDPGAAQVRVRAVVRVLLSRTVPALGPQTPGDPPIPQGGVVHTVTLERTIDVATWRAVD